MHSFLVLIALLAFAGCTTTFEPKPLPPDHPASVQAPEAPHSGARRLIASDELSRKTEMELTRQDVPSPDFQDSGMSHDMSNTEAGRQTSSGHVNSRGSNLHLPDASRSAVR